MNEVVPDIPDWMIKEDDPVLAEIAKRIEHLEIGINAQAPVDPKNPPDPKHPTDPTCTSHCLGHYVWEDKNGIKKSVQLHVIHAVDVIITDGKKVVVIERKQPPAMGKPCFPGGMLDPLDPARNGVETAEQAAIREAMEEVSIELKSKGIPVGKRIMNRPGDVRICAGNGLKTKYGVHDGDIFMVTTQPMLFHVDNVDALKLKPESDAKLAKKMEINDLRAGGHDSMGPDQYEMLMEAFGNRKRISKRLWNQQSDQGAGMAL